MPAPPKIDNDASIETIVRILAGGGSRAEAAAELGVATSSVVRLIQRRPEILLQVEKLRVSLDAKVTRAQRSEQKRQAQAAQPPRPLPPPRSTPRGDRADGRVLRPFSIPGPAEMLSGVDGYMPEPEFLGDTSFERSDPPEEWLTARSRRHTLREPTSGRLVRIEPRDEAYPDLLAAGWLRA